MILNKQIKYRLSILIQTAFIFAWLSHLVSTDGYFSVYVVCALGGFYCLIDNSRDSQQIVKRERILTFLVSFLFSILVVLANYSYFIQIRDLQVISYSTNFLLNVLNVGCALIGGISIAYNVIVYSLHRLPLPNAECNRNHPRKCFLVTFLSVLVIQLVYLFFVEYPGNLSLDSIVQVEQIRDGIYSNHHPFWHTMIIKVFLDIGYFLFRNPNAAVAVFSVAQIVVMALCFSYVIATLYQAKVPAFWIAVAYCLYVFMPYNIAYGSTMWKDVPFGIAVCVFTVSFYRIMNGFGKKQIWNYVLLSIGGIGFCLLRSNGFLAFFASTVLFCFALTKKHKKVLLLMCGILAFSWVLKNPVLAVLDVKQPDTVESLSIPLQQIARYICDGNELTAAESELLEKVMDTSKIPVLYDPGLSDNIKNEIRGKNPVYFDENIGDYLKLWVQLGVKAPDSYIKAWIDQTKGYWGGGYENWIYCEFIEPNDMGIVETEASSIIYALYKMYFTFTRWVVFFQPLNSIGLYVWILAVVCFVCLLRRKKEWLLSFPILAIVLTLMVATPVYAEFRYAYALFTTLPFIVPVSLCKTE